jgi:hypothetical protein
MAACAAMTFREFDAILHCDASFGLAVHLPVYDDQIKEWLGCFFMQSEVGIQITHPF